MAYAEPKMASISGDNATFVIFVITVLPAKQMNKAGTSAKRIKLMTAAFFLDVTVANCAVKSPKHACVRLMAAKPAINATVIYKRVLSRRYAPTPRTPIPIMTISVSGMAHLLLVGLLSCEYLV
jgi:hypothetical protein